MLTLGFRAFKEGYLTAELIKVRALPGRSSLGFQGLQK